MPQRHHISMLALDAVAISSCVMQHVILAMAHELKETIHPWVIQ